MKLTRLACFVLLLTALVLSASLTWAQSATSSLSGTILDAKGALIPGADVTLSNALNGFTRTVKTTNEGVYQFLQVPPAAYELAVSATGFATVKRSNVVLQVSSPATVNLTLQVQGQAVSIEVSAEAPAVNTSDATLGHNFNTKQLIDLPSEGRDPASILSLQPGVTYIGKKTHADQNDDSRGGSVNGARSDQTNITLDGLDNNDQLNGYAFEGALRTTLDSLQEFRVTTSNADADSGRSSGAQVNLVTKTGTNSIHGSVYEYHRPTFTTANDWFNKQAELKAGLPNRPGKILRNTFGASVGGPIKKDRIFFFGAYEGQRSAETKQETRTVPSDNLRNGLISYLCDPSINPSTGQPVDPNCKNGNLAGVTVADDPRFPNSKVATLSSPQFASLDQGCSAAGTCPLGPGFNPLIAGNASGVFQNYPSPNTDAAANADGLDFRGFTFAAPDPIKHDTYIAKLDFKLTQNGNHTLFVRANLQNDHEKTPPQFPKQPPNQFVTDNSKGIAAGYTALLSNTLINNFRYAFVRQGTGEAGLATANFINFRGLDDVQALDSSTRTVFTNVPVHNFVDDLSWTKGNHTFQFGGNLRLIRNNRQSNRQNFTEGITNAFWLANSAIAGTGVSLDPAIGANYPAVEGDFGGSYDFAALAAAGIITEVSATTNKDKTGAVLNQGTLVPRHFQSFEAEMYVQDKWRVRPNLTVTYGLRYSMLQPPYENRGNQVAPTFSLHDWFNTRGRDQAKGIVTQPDVTFNLSGQANGGKPIWNWDYHNLAPRLAIAYSPDNGKSSIRAGYGLYFDHFGQGVINTFDRQGSYGLTTTQENPAGIQTVDGAPRFTGLTGAANIPGIINPPPPGPFPYTPSGDPNGAGLAIAWGLDDKLKTPYSHVFDLSFTHQMGKNLVIEATYTGRLGRRLLQEADLAQPLDLVDPKSGVDYFKAATQFAKLAEQNTPIGSVSPIPYWENMFPLAANFSGGGCGLTGENIPNPTPTQAMYDAFACNLGNETFPLENADAFCTPACVGTAIDPVTGQLGTQFQYYQKQFASLYSWRSQGSSTYHGMQLSLRHPLSSGLQFDLNYTYSKSIDVGSNAERVNGFESANLAFNSQVINAWSPNQWRAVSDFDTTHQINANWVWELPYGRGRHWGSGSHGFMEALLGGWGFNGLARWTSGFPFTVQAGTGWSTNFELEGSSVLIGAKPSTGVFRDSNGDPNIFRDPNSLAIGNGILRQTYPGEAGQRNNFRGPGYFGIDTGVGKVWKPAESQEIRFSWEVFNVTNSVRFDAAGSVSNESLFTLTGFGKYVQALTNPRVMQFGLRYSF